MMKLSTILTLAAAAVLASCNEGSRLASAIEGTWSSAPEHLSDNTAASATTIDTYTFEIDEGNDKGGVLMISSLVSTTGQISGSDAIVQPFSLSAASTATVNGTWEAVDDDEINVSVDMSTLQVNVDPDAVVLSTSVLTGDNYNSVDSMKPALVNSIKAQVTKAITMRYASIKRIDDIDIKGDVMQWEINDVKSSLSRQGPGPKTAQ